MIELQDKLKQYDRINEAETSSNTHTTVGHEDSEGGYTGEDDIEEDAEEACSDAQKRGQ